MAITVSYMEDGKYIPIRTKKGPNSYRLMDGENKLNSTSKGHHLVESH